MTKVIYRNNSSWWIWNYTILLNRARFIYFIAQLLGIFALFEIIKPVLKILSFIYIAFLAYLFFLVPFTDTFGFGCYIRTVEAVKLSSTKIVIDKFTWFIQVLFCLVKLELTASFKLNRILNQHWWLWWFHLYYNL